MNSLGTQERETVQIDVIAVSIDSRVRNLIADQEAQLKRSMRGVDVGEFFGLLMDNNLGREAAIAIITDLIRKAIEIMALFPDNYDRVANLIYWMIQSREMARSLSVDELQFVFKNKDVIVRVLELLSLFGHLGLAAHIAYILDTASREELELLITCMEKSEFKQKCTGFLSHLERISKRSIQLDPQQSYLWLLLMDAAFLLQQERNEPNGGRSAII